jgi:hypothetical protein
MEVVNHKQHSTNYNCFDAEKALQNPAITAD